MPVSCTYPEAVGLAKRTWPSVLRLKPTPRPLSPPGPTRLRTRWVGVEDGSLIRRQPGAGGEGSLSRRQRVVVGEVYSREAASAGVGTELESGEPPQAKARPTRKRTRKMEGRMGRSLIGQRRC